MLRVRDGPFVGGEGLALGVLVAGGALLLLDLRTGYAVGCEQGDELLFAECEA